MSWEIVVGIIALVGFLGTVSSWVWKLSGTLAKLSDGLNSLSDFKKNADREHRAIHETLDDHELRIHDLENHKKER